jgi:TonB-linked SusC/RagA family outer membrane protein
MRYKSITARFEMKCALLIIVLLGLVWSVSLAKNKNFYLNHEGVFYEIYNSENFIDVTVSGIISDEQGKEIPGVNVIEKGTTRGTVSDASGKFLLRVTDGNSILVFSAVGYITQEIAVGSSTEINVTMKLSSKKLDEVVVVGYGTQKKSELTNAVVQTSGEELKKSNAASLSNSLSGRLAGLYVNQRSAVPGFDDAQILVRGANTYRNSSALIVIDGVANADPDGLNRLDPNDIASVSVLKDASAAIYGAQSAGGVILVTTKRGKTGKPVFDVNANQSWQSPTTKVRSANALEYMKVLNDRRLLEGTPPDFPDDFVNAFKNGDRRAEDWWNALIGNPINQSRESLTMRGGSEKFKYFNSIGTVSQGGILRGDKTTKLRQYNIRSNMDVQVTNSFSVGLDLSLREKYTQTPQAGPGGSLEYLAVTSPLQEAYIDGDYRYPGQGWSQSNPAARLLSPGYRRYTADVASGIINFKYNIPFIPGLSLDGFASIDKTLNYNKTFNYTWFYFEKDASGNIVKKPSRVIEDIGLREDFTRSQRITENIKLSYNKRIHEDHDISAFIAYEESGYKDNYFWAQRLGYQSPLIDQLFAGSTDRQNWNNDGSGTESGRENVFGRATYAYKSKYLLGLSARYDGSTIFPKDTRFGFFPQASVGWVLSKESFIPKIFSNLKLRASWGQLGNDRVAPFQYIGAFGYTTGWVVDGTDVRGIAATTTPNPNITWEVSEKTDLGLEAGFLGNKITFEVDLYQSKTSNILGKRQASIPGYTGLILPDENIGKMDSKGIEFQGGYHDNFGQLYFSFDGNVSYNENKIIFFDEAPLAEPYQKQEGKPLNAVLVYKSIGIYRTQKDLDNNVNYPGATLGGLIFADLNGDGVINSDDTYRYDASAFPKMQFGFNFGFDYKNFGLSFLLQGQSGAKWRLSNGFNSGANGNGLEYVALNSYSLENVNSALPMIEPNGVSASNSDFYYHKLTFLRFKSIELGYNLPTNLISKVKISSLRFYVSADNLFMVYNNLHKYGFGDPEFLSSNGGVYPNMKTINIGLNLTF